MGVERRVRGSFGVQLAESFETRNLRLYIPSHAGKNLLFMRIVARPLGLLADGKPIERRLGYIDMSFPDQFGHLPKEKRQEQRRDVMTLRVAGHQQDNLAAA